MRFGRRYLLSLAPTLLLGTALLSASPALAADCPNEAIREAQTSEALPQGTVDLPACMALEMVSPAKKFVQPAFEPVFSPDGERVRFRSLAALAGTPGLQFPFGDNYVASRGMAGWSTAPTSPPADADVVRGGEVAGGPYAYLPDFSRWLGFGVSNSEMQAGLLQLYAGGLDGAFEPTTPLLVPIDDSGNLAVSFTAANAGSNGSSLDLSTTVFRTNLASTSFLPGDPRSNEVTPEPGGDNNSYLVDRDGGSEPSLELLARDKDEVVYGGRCGTRLGGGSNAGRGSGRLTQGAISPDGERIFFSTRPAQPFDEEKAGGPQCDTDNPLRIMVRTQIPDGPAIEGLIEGDDPEEAGDDLYQGASVDGTKVYLTSSRALAGSDGDGGAECSRVPGASAGCDLYLYDSELPEGSRLVQVSAGEPGSPTPGSGAEVLSSITAVSTDGSHAYFAAEGVLTVDANPEGDAATAGEPNLYVYADGDLAFIGTLADADGDLSRGMWGAEQAFIGDASAVPMHGTPGGGDGHILVFASKAPLTSDDADGGTRDLFRYDAEVGTLERLSKAAEGGSEEPASDVEVNPGPTDDSPERPRWVSEDGLTVAFSTAEPLVPGDENVAADPYFFKEGAVHRLPGDGEMPTLSPDGSEIGFTTSLPLLPVDGDTAQDVYIARANGGFPNPAPSPVCDPRTEGSCRGVPVAAPQISAPATGTFSGPGNRRTSPSCRRPKVRRKGRCVKPKRRAAKNGKRADRKRRARR